MAITFNKVLIGTYTYHSRDSHDYEIEMRMGNCDSVHIWLDKETGEPHLFNFIAGTEHLKRCEKDKIDIFEDCTQIKLNAWHRPNIRLMLHAVKNGHLVTMYYDNFKENEKI